MRLLIMNSVFDYFFKSRTAGYFRIFSIILAGSYLVKAAFKTLDGDFSFHIKQKSPGFLYRGTLFILVCFVSVYNKGSRSITKIIAKIKPGICAFVCHLKIKIGKQFNSTKNAPLKKAGHV